MLLSLTSAAGIKINSTGLDGINQWPTINMGKKSQRREFIYNIDPIFQFGAIMKDVFKFVNGSLNNAFNGWLGDVMNSTMNVSLNDYINSVLESNVSKSIRSIQRKKVYVTERDIRRLRSSAIVTCNKSTLKNPCDLRNGPCLFNIIQDPCEENNLAQSNIQKFQYMQNVFEMWTSKVVPSRRKPIDAGCDPVNFNGNWNWWQVDGQIV